MPRGKQSGIPESIVWEDRPRPWCGVQGADNKTTEEGCVFAHHCESSLGSMWKWLITAEQHSFPIIWREMGQVCDFWSTGVGTIINLSPPVKGPFGYKSCNLALKNVSLTSLYYVVAYNCSVFVVVEGVEGGEEFRPRCWTPIEVDKLTSPISLVWAVGSCLVYHMGNIGS